MPHSPSQDRNDRAAALERRIIALVDPFTAGVDIPAQAERNAKHFNDFAAAYDSDPDAALYLPPARLARLVAACLPAGSDPILDVACGTGLMGEHLRGLGHDNLTGVDVAQKMVALATARGLYRQVLCADLHAELPFPPGHFAAITCAGGLYGYIVAVSALARLLPLLRPGGFLFADI